MYRVGSQHIAPLFSKSPSHRKRTDTYEYPDDSMADPSHPTPNQKNLDIILTSNGSNSSNPYDIPREVLDSNTYSIPVGIPAVVDYINHAIVTQVSVEPLVPPPHGSVYQHPRNSDSTDSEGVVSDQKVESGDYIYMSSCPDEEGGVKEPATQEVKEM